MKSTGMGQRKRFWGLLLPLRFQKKSLWLFYKTGIDVKRAKVKLNPVEMYFGISAI